MPGLEDLYREIILDHHRNPRNRGELPPPAPHAVGHNPLCGDEIDVYLDVRDGLVADVKVGGQGCSISQSSASMMSQAVKGKPIADVKALVRRFKGMMSIPDDDGNPIEPDPNVATDDARRALEGHAIRLDVPPDLPLVRADPQLLHHCLLNLLDNAGRYGEPGTQIVIEGRHRFGELRLAVLDQGQHRPVGR